MNKPLIRLQVPGGAKKILLHACCAPCSGAIVECMLADGLQPTIFYFNPNIFPLEEYERRKTESIRHAESLQLPFIDGDYKHDVWLNRVSGLEDEPERGRRCLACFKLRLEETAHYAHRYGFPVFTTTLAASRWKDLQQVAEAGQHGASTCPGVTFWEQNWRKGGLDRRRNALINHYQFYNQSYCGCEFSLPEKP